jgi:hypothetical protein
MNTRLSKLLEKLTPAEQAEVATFAAFLLARRNREKLQLLTDEASAGELVQLAADSGSFDWLDAPEEDVYSLEDGRPVKRHSIVELRGLGKEIWAGIDAQEYVDQERRSWHG